jgi:acyl-coenzyme A thioesterase PaaI-like protein
MTTPEHTAVQDFYPDDFAHCYGCGRLNAHGYHLRTWWEGDETVTRFNPEAHHIAMPGFVYGGLLASLLDCHAMATAAAATLRRDEREIGDVPSPRFVTAMLHVDFLRPTPIGHELEIRGVVDELGERKVKVNARVVVGGETTVRATAVAVRRPEAMSTSATTPRPAT